MNIADPAATMITQAIVTLGCNPEDGGLSEAPSNVPRELAISLAPHAFSVHLDVHLAWLVNETISRLTIAHAPSDKATNEYLDTMAKARILTLHDCLRHTHT